MVIFVMWVKFLHGFDFASKLNNLNALFWVIISIVSVQSSPVLASGWVGCIEICQLIAEGASVVKVFLYTSCYLSGIEWFNALNRFCGRVDTEC